MQHHVGGIALQFTKSLKVVKLGALAAIVLLFVIIHLLNPAFLPHMCGLLAR